MAARRSPEPAEPEETSTASEEPGQLNPLYRPDPFDLDTLRVTGLEDIGVERVLVSIPVRKPRRDEFFRVHPGEDMRVDWYVLERPDDQEVYWVTPRTQAALLGELKAVRVFACVDKHSNLFLWPARLPAADNRLGRRWHESGLEIAAHAEKYWVRMVGDRRAGVYVAHRARGDLGQPQWGDYTLRQLLELGFSGDRVIEDLDHPVFRELAGEL